jgi:hypothetical protein
VQSLRLVLLSLLLLSCSAQEAGTSLEGGQTGSLLPPDCAVPAASALRVSEGDAAFVAYVPAGAVVDVQLRDSEQQPVELMLELIEEGSDARVARSSQALTAGQYQLVYRCATPLGPVEVRESLTVVPAEATLATLGTLQPNFDSGETRQCGSFLDFELALTPEAIAHEQLIQLEVSINGQQPFIVVPFGTLRSRDGRVSLLLHHCSDEALPTCLPSGQSSVRVLATVAGEMLDVEGASLELDTKCRLADEGGLDCAFSLASPASRLTGWLAGLLALFSLLFSLRRLSRRVPVD